MKSMVSIYLENEANKLREEIGARMEDPISIHQILKYKKVLGYFEPLDNGLSGMAIKIYDDGKDAKRFMLINTDDPYCKQRFTAAHELYHLLVQNDFYYSYDEDVWGSADEEEKKANWFAMFLLLPEQGIKLLIPVDEQKRDRITISTLLKLEHNYRCSRQSLLYRLKHLKLVSEEYVEAHRTKVKQTAIEYGYDISLYEPTRKTELVGDYNVLARRLYDSGKISQAKYYSYLRDMGINKVLEDNNAKENSIA